ncbi:MAG: hypothetical protein WCS17_03930 [Prevotella sp.]
MDSIESMFNIAYQAACDALDETVEKIFEESRDDYCPVDKGVLKASAKNELIENSTTSHTRELSYNTNYAIYPHERLNLHHIHGSAKFLEIPCEQNEDKLYETLKSAFGDALGN